MALMGIQRAVLPLFIKKLGLPLRCIPGATVCNCRDFSHSPHIMLITARSFWV